MNGERAAVLRAERITKAYPGVVANEDVSVDLRRGEIHAIVGENGAGKTTLMGILFGLLRPDAGGILVDGKPFELHLPRDALGLGIGFVQQHFSLIPTLTVAENVVLALRGSEEPIKLSEGSARVRALSSEYGIEADPDAVVEELSVGQQQRAELLKALAGRARILLLDEPNALLTPQEWEELAAVLRRLAAAGVAIFLVSHKLEEVVRVADRITVMRRGRVVATIAAREATHQRLAELMVGELEAHERPVTGAARVGHAKPRLEVRGLSVASDRGGRAVGDVSFAIRPGEVLGLAGVEGSGQVELTEALAGGRPPERGTVHLDGRDVTRMSVRERHRAGIAHIPADRRDAGLVATLSVAENLCLPLVDGEPFSVFGVLRKRALRERADTLVERFDIRVPSPDVPAGALSGGNQQKVVLARELSGKPRAVVACYPTRGLDFHAAEVVRRLILSLRDQGAAILYASVDLDELIEVSDHILVLHHGQTSGEVAAAEATPEGLGLLMGGAAA
jgi:general nucleoside transport system ATP-binding protein